MTEWSDAEQTLTTSVLSKYVFKVVAIKSKRLSSNELLGDEFSSLGLLNILAANLAVDLAIPFS